MSKQFAVHVSYVTTGIIMVDAESEDEAETMVEDTFDVDDILPDSETKSDFAVEYAEAVD